ncbi:MAG: 16S rRNA (guanine(966)-N(2))-methyltransferase RsmD [Wenzhouxiangella sp.]|nr:16S rRNA (guanine(966)-N(2))-methyltransferase RsmD [Wenzhouxiangella sp.]
MTGKIRIISGQWRGRRIPVLDHPELRPTGDRARETLFNWLGPRVIGKRCLDLFAGSGALGLEAASRGATDVWLIDRDRKLAAALFELVSSWPGGDRVRVEQAEGMPWLQSCEQRFDICFLDPPFGQGLQGRALEALAGSACCQPGCLVYVECYLDEEAALQPALSQNWKELRNKRQGRVILRLLEHRQDSLAKTQGRQGKSQ